MQNFTAFQLPAELQATLAKMNFVTPTPIQADAIPVALEGRDIIGTAQTGTGKTGAFGIPLITFLMNNPESKALVMAPTRELAAQVVDMLKKMTNGIKGLKHALLIGGDAMFKQLRQLDSNPRLIVGTPGRIYDHLRRGSLNLDDAKFLVLDETDRMLDMGFGIQIDEILEHVPSERQTLMFSATMPNNIVSLAGKYLVDPARISSGQLNSPAVKIKQETIKIEEIDKYEQLQVQLAARDGSLVIFVKTKYSADKMAKRLRTDGHEAEAIHGDLRQRQRERVIKDFRKQETRILVATDVAARGLDIPHIEHVINYDMPQCPEDYVHRIGRTGRAGASGEAVNFVTPQDGRKWSAICKLIDPNFKQEPKSDRPKKKKKKFGKGRDENRQEGARFDRPKREKAVKDAFDFDDDAMTEEQPKKRRFDAKPPRKSFVDRSEAFGRRSDKPRDFKKKDGFKKRDDRKSAFGDREDRFEKRDRPAKRDGFKKDDRRPKFGERDERRSDRNDRPNRSEGGFKRDGFKKRDDRRSAFGDREDRFEKRDRPAKRDGFKKDDRRPKFGSRDNRKETGEGAYKKREERRSKFDRDERKSSRSDRPSRGEGGFKRKDDSRPKLRAKIGGEHSGATKGKIVKKARRSAISDALSIDV